MSTLGNALLGLLAERPRTGYELARLMDRPIGYLWTARHSQIYPELARLEAAGLVVHEVVEGPGPRDTKRYRLTDDGERTLRAWVLEPLAPQPARSELLLRVRSLWLVSPAEAVAFLREVRADHERLLATFRAELETFGASSRTGAAARAGDRDGQEFFRRATLVNGISYEEHMVAWCGWLLDELADS